METKTTALPSQTQQPTPGKVGGILELIHMSEEERLKHHIDIDTYRTNLSVMKNERAEGIEEGFAIGERKSKMAIAKQMKTDGLPIDMIQKYTGDYLRI